jgi:L-amino acid N-acyltransferase YncA
MEMKIRMATKDDWPTLEALNKVIDYSQPKPFMLENVKLGRVLVAEIGGRAIGYALWQIIWGNTPLLALVKVFPEDQLKGAGKAINREFEKRIKADGFKNYLSSTMANNPDGKVFHVQMGFTEIGTLKMHYGDELFYRKVL